MSYHREQIKLSMMEIFVWMLAYEGIREEQRAASRLVEFHDEGSTVGT
jgi:hypothetical protein